jgi:hypothetical protein
MNVSKKRHENWEEIASYLLRGYSNQEIFDSFIFLDDNGNHMKVPDRRYKDIFKQYSVDIKLPKSLRAVCGGHVGKAPGLGFELDFKVFQYLYTTYIVPNEYMEQIKDRKFINNNVVKDAISFVLNSATDEELKDVTFSSQAVELMQKVKPDFNPETDQKLFMYQKDALLAFRVRWHIVGPGLRIRPLKGVNNRGDIVQRSAHGILNHPDAVNGYPLPENLKGDDFTSDNSGSTASLQNNKKTLKLPAGKYCQSVIKINNVHRSFDPNTPSDTTYR